MSTAIERRMYGHDAALPCQRRGAWNRTQVSHSNQLRDGKARGMKSHYWRVAALCDACHYEIDQGHRLTKDERRAEWDAAHKSTIGRLFETGALVPA